MVSGSVAKNVADCVYDPQATNSIRSYMGLVQKILQSAKFNADYAYPGPVKITPFSLGSCKKTENTFFATDSVINAIRVAAGGAESKATCVGSSKEYAASVPLSASPGDSWCVDSSGVSKQIKGIITSTICK